MNIGAAGTASGLDINGMVKSIVDAERAPKESRINQQRDQVDVSLSAYGRLKGSLDTMKNLMADFRRNDVMSARSVSIDNDEVLAANVSSEAIPGKYTVNVQQLAQSHKIVSSSFDEKEKMGAGKLSMALGGKPFTVDIPADESKILDVVRLINRAPDNPGVMASVIKDDNGARLVLAADKTGEQNSIKVNVEAPAFSTLQKFGFNINNDANSMREMQPAVDSRVLIDGLASVTSSTNNIEDAINGVDIDLKKLTDGVDTPDVVVDVGYDRNQVGGSIEQFVNAYNQFFDVSQELGRFDPESQEKGPLVGDSITRSVTNQLRGAFANPVEGAPESIQTLSELGITTTMAGRLEVDYDILDKQLDQNFNDVGEFFGGQNGFARRIEDLIHSYTGITGSIKGRENSLNDQVMRLNTDQTNLDRRMESVKQRTHDQFVAMDAAMGQMKGQLGSMMSMMPQF
ncbi:flagellar hook protein [Photobacterium profundum]|uniref:Flagellar hook-associated protein 2 n=1 Tax=Photobacterium profundum 3TCK TaxID=314280 RepID=Q1Z7B9_9GAMM|nr:flagellar filament capping protein FliD [Photobacterium profundum]EAS44540.1 putative flagellar hook-associated protein 2 [Photobacterium profundum 3TCK]PSV64598.1 flagellar hook protein [Photobacterium profundum]